MELSYEEVVSAVKEWFEFVEERDVEGLRYSEDRLAGKGSTFCGKFWVCRRNGVEVYGESEECFRD